MLLVPFPVDESPGAEDVEVEEEGNDITLRYFFTTYAPQYMYYHTIYMYYYLSVCNVYTSKTTSFTTHTLDTLQ